MARKTTMAPMVGADGGLGRKIVTGLVVLAVLAMVIKDPAGSAHTVVAVLRWAGDVVEALSTFGQALSGRA